MHTYLYPFSKKKIIIIITFWQSKCKEDTSATQSILLDKLKLEAYPFLLHAFQLSRVTCHSSFLPFFFLFCFQADPKPLSVYHPTSKEVSVTMGTPMVGLFDGLDIMAKAMDSTPTTA